MCAAIGLLLGILSAFLGIGGGPINLVVLYYFFSMETQRAAQNSLYIIFFSQMTSFLLTIFTQAIPDVNILVFILMALGGLLGGIVGRYVNKKMEACIVERLFIGLMMVIILLCAHNIVQFRS